jgi:hypothetical protein
MILSRLVAKVSLDRLPEGLSGHPRPKSCVSDTETQHRYSSLVVETNSGSFWSSPASCRPGAGLRSGQGGWRRTVTGKRIALLAGIKASEVIGAGKGR